jgi:hypothetical protein
LQSSIVLVLNIVIVVFLFVITIPGITVIRAGRILVYKEAGQDVKAYTEHGAVFRGRVKQRRDTV